jgi:APA family basic amino acid/polyamine antiporter
VTGLVLTGLASYKLLGVPDPMSIGLDSLGPSLFWLKILIKLAIWVGLASVVLVQLLGQTRIFYAISRDGLLPKAFGSVNHKFGTPVFAAIITAIISMIAASLFPIEVLGELVSMATLFLFTIVCLGVLILRKTHPEYKRQFKVPFVPVLPLLGMAACIAQMSFLQRFTWMQFMGWLTVGLLIYFGYSVKKSHLRKHEITKV